MDIEEGIVQKNMEITALMLKKKKKRMLGKLTLVHNNSVANTIFSS